MSEKLTGEAVPDDFEGQVKWVDNCSLSYLEQAMSEGKSCRHSQTDEQMPRAILFSPKLGRAIELEDMERPLIHRTRNARLRPGVFFRSMLYLQAPRIPHMATWDTYDGEV